jgi:ribosomal protein S18 acetylase RimI-like enzyme
VAEIEIRPAISSDIPELMSFDHSVSTGHIWQVDANIVEREISVRLLETRLPRPLTLAYPKRVEEMADTWTEHSLFLIARMDAKLVGYLTLSIEKDTRTALITNLVVNANFRNQGIASGLVVAVRNHLRNTGIRRLLMAIPVRNEAALALATKLKMTFCGYINHYFVNQDAALFYSLAVK